ncbi:hypothetical protein QB607_003198 [Clostridium botulinum]|nr:hypothetical protein [Clostridium botulinum]EKS4395871.1 hypothetical protein [Clostridium botulinum]
MDKFNFKEISIFDIELFEGSYFLDGYYKDKYFKLNIEPEKNEFTLMYDDTLCTDNELKHIFNNVKQYCKPEYITK